MVTPRQPERLEVEGGVVPHVAPVSMRRPEWWAEAECRRRAVPLDLFFPPPSDHEAVRAAKAVCAECAAREACLAFAVEERIEHGVWGGLSRPERKKEQRRATS